jgi:hypothetical protein
MRRIIFSLVTIFAFAAPVSSLLACPMHDKAKATEETGETKTPVAANETDGTNGESEKTASSLEVRQGKILTEVNPSEGSEASQN